MPTISSNLPEFEYEIIVKERRRVMKEDRDWKPTGRDDKPYDYTPPLAVEAIEERQVFTLTTPKDPTGDLLRMMAGIPGK
jgi:hypothetical protein